MQKKKESLETIFLIGIACLSSYLNYQFIFEPFYLSGFGKVHVISCQRKSREVICQNQRVGIFGNSLEVIEFKLISPGVEDYPHSDGASSYRLYLETDIGKVDLEDYGGHFERANQDAARFKSLLTNDEETAISLKYGNGLLKNLLVFLIGGVSFYPIFLILVTVLIEMPKWIFRKLDI